MRAALVALLAGVAWASPAPALPDDPEPRGESYWLTSPQLLGDPAGVRTRLDEFGITLQLFYNQYLAWKPSGGGENTHSVFGHSGSADFYGLVDFEELVGWPGLGFLLHVKGQYDRNLNEDVGALSNPIDDADFDEPIYVDELWFQQGLFRDRLRLRFGFLEQQTLFDRNAYANSEDWQFLTTFLDNNPLVPLPNGLGAALIAAPLPWLELAVGAADGDNVSRKAGFDTAFDGIDSVSGFLELLFRVELPGGSGPLPGNYRLGLFVDGRDRIVFDSNDPGTGLPETRRGHLGAYLSFDQRVFREKERGREGLGLFARFGGADPDVNRIAWFWSLGLQYEGALPCRDADVLGLGVYQTIASDTYRDNVDPDFDRETGIELYYRVAALPWLAITPDLQYIVDPGATGTKDTFVGVMRFRVSF